MNLREQIKNYKPFDEQEEKDKEQFLQFISNFDNVLTRDNTLGHFTASAFVVNKERTKMLLVYHLINDGWIYPGGHVDGETNFLKVAVREVEEETGLKPKILSKNIFAIQSGPVIGHVKHGKYVSAHLHLDVLYLMEASDKSILKFKEDESKGIKWVSFEEADKRNVCNFVKPVHRKIINKLKELNL